MLEQKKNLFLLFCRNNSASFQPQSQSDLFIVFVRFSAHQMESGMTNYPVDEKVSVSSSRCSRVGARLSEWISIAQASGGRRFKLKTEGYPLSSQPAHQVFQTDVQSLRRSEKVCGFSIQYLRINTNCFYTAITKKNDATCETKDIPLGLNHSLSETQATIFLHKLQ